MGKTLRFDEISIRPNTDGTFYVVGKTKVFDASGNHVAWSLIDIPRAVIDAEDESVTCLVKHAKEDF